MEDRTGYRQNPEMRGEDSSDEKRRMGMEYRGGTVNSDKNKKKNQNCRRNEPEDELIVWEPPETNRARTVSDWNRSLQPLLPHRCDWLAGRVTIGRCVRIYLKLKETPV